MKTPKQRNYYWLMFSLVLFSFSSIIYAQTEIFGLPFESIELKERNWENQGDNIVIGSNGSYSIVIETPMGLEEIGAGEVSQEEMSEITSLITRSGLSALEEREGTPVEEANVDDYTSWKGYELVISFEDEEKDRTIRFHSADPSVPEELWEVVERIYEITSSSV